MIYEVEVRPGPGTEFFQYYTETIEAPTSHDAEARVRRANPGCIVRTTKSWSEYDDDSDSSSGGGEIDGAGILVLAALAFIVFFWKYILIIGGIGIMIWGLMILFKSDY